ncbi:MAG: NEW3 domain-containing protein [Methanocella sp.]
MVEGQRGGESISRLKTLALALCLLALLALASVPPAHAALTGGPIIDAAIYGNVEFYPGQTAPLLVVVQNEGYLQSLSGVKTQETLLSQSNLALSASQAASSASSGTRSSQVQASESASNQSPGYVASAGASGLADLTTSADTSISASASRSYSDDYQTSTFGGVEINTQENVPLEATTALGMVCQLTTGTAPVSVITEDRALLGSLLPGEVGGGPSAYSAFSGLYQPIQYWIQVNPGAKPGRYFLPLVCTYKHLVDDYGLASIDGTVLRNKNYVETTTVVMLEIVIMERFDLVLSETVCNNMVPGTDGIICMKVTNLGNLSVEHAVAYLMTPTLGAPQDEINYPLNYQLLSYQAYTAGQPRPVEQNMLVPVQNTQYLGHMEPGESRTIKFKVSVSDDAESSDIPLSAAVSYNDPWDEQKSSNVETFGVSVEPEMRFDVNAEPIEIKCGRSCVSNLTLVNNGSQLARDAIVRMNALDPFTVSYDTMYLGDVAPGENVTTRYGIKVKPDAVPGDYYVTLEVKYYDSQDDPHVTKIIRKAIVVLPPPTLLETLMENWPLVLGLAALVALGLLYMGYKWLAKKKKPPAAKQVLPAQEDMLITEGNGERLNDIDNKNM